MKPVLQALVLADHVYEDSATKKKVIAGTFNRIVFGTKSLREAPGEQKGTSPDGVRQVRGGMHVGSPYLYISLTDVKGSIPLSIRYVDLRENMVLLETKTTVQSSDPLATAELIVPMPPLPVPHEGAYAIELLTEDDPIGALRIVAVPLAKEG